MSILSRLASTLAVLAFGLVGVVTALAGAVGWVLRALIDVWAESPKGKP